MRLLSARSSSRWSRVWRRRERALRRHATRASAVRAASRLVAEHPALELPLLPAREQRQVLPREQHHAAVEEQAVHAAERAKNGLAKHPELCGQSWLGFLRPASFLERSWINMAHCGQQEATALAWLGPMQLEYRTCSIGAHARARSYTLPARSSTVPQRDVLARLGPVLASSSSAFIWHAHMEEKAHVHLEHGRLGKTRLLEGTDNKQGVSAVEQTQCREERSRHSMQAIGRAEV
eukprot:6180800-Pleurochrysis_carterae.AAC.1